MHLAFAVFPLRPRAQGGVQERGAFRLGESGGGARGDDLGGCRIACRATIVCSLRIKSSVF